MGFNISEDWKSRVRNNDNMERKYVLIHDGLGDSDDTTAVTALYFYLQDTANIPGIDPVVFPQYDIGVEEISGLDPPTFTGFGKWKVRVGRYLQAPQPVQENTFNFTYSGSAKAAHLMQGYKTEYSRSVRAALQIPGAEESDKADFYGFINVENDNGEMKAKGVDISPPPSAFVINWAVPGSRFDSVYQVDMLKILGSTNLTSFKLFGHIFAASELFFNSISGTKRTDADWMINIGFGFDEDHSSGDEDDGSWLPVFNGTFKIPKKGHRYIWSYNPPAWNATKEQLQMTGKKSTIFVERVWPEIDWTRTRLNELQNLPMG